MELIRTERVNIHIYFEQILIFKNCLIFVKFLAEGGHFFAFWRLFLTGAGNRFRNSELPMHRSFDLIFLPNPPLSLSSNTFTLLQHFHNSLTARTQPEREREKKSAVKIQNSQKIFKAEATFVSVLQGLQGLQGLEDLFGFLVAPFCRLCLLLLCPCQLKHCLLPADGDQLLKWRAVF